MRVPHNGFIVVADGEKMLFLRNGGDSSFLNLTVEQIIRQTNPADRDQKSDQPGRAFASVGEARAAYAEADFHQLGEERFAAELAEMLKERALRNDFESLVVVAPPKTLGELRKRYDKEVGKRIVAEIPKDLTGHPVEEIEKILSAQ